MTDQDPRYQETTRTTVAETDPLRPAGPAHVETVETTVTGRQTSNTAWWVAGVVALAAIVGVVWMVVSTNEAQEDVIASEGDAAAVQDAIADARVQGQFEGAQNGLAAASEARAAADRAAAEAAAARAEAARSDPPAVVIVQPAEPAPEPAGPPPVG